MSSPAPAVPRTLSTEALRSGYGGRVVVDGDTVRGRCRPRYEAGSGTLAATMKSGRSRTA